MTVEYQEQKVTVAADPQSMGIGLGMPVARDYVERDPYTGEYTVTPTDEDQVLVTKYMRMTDNITVKAVPSNYGKIDWNGSYLTVS